MSTPYVFRLGLPGAGRPMRVCAKAGDAGLPDGRVVPVPREFRFGEENGVNAGGRLMLPPLEYSEAVGVGRNDGVVGRETGVGIELTVLVVAFVLTLLLPSESRDCGRRMPLAAGMLLCDDELGGRISEGELALTVVSGRKAEGAVGPDRRR